MHTRRYLCLVIDRQSRKQLAEYTIVIESQYVASYVASADMDFSRRARIEALDRFKADYPNNTINDWYVDSVLID